MTGQLYPKALTSPWNPFDSRSFRHLCTELGIPPNRLREGGLIGNDLPRPRPLHVGDGEDVQRLLVGAVLEEDREEVRVVVVGLVELEGLYLPVREPRGPAEGDRLLLEPAEVILDGLNEVERELAEVGQRFIR
jgi:hypothetical protein